MSASVSAPVSSPGNLKIGIFGFGTFAQFLAKAMIKQGHSLRATSRTDYSQRCADLGIAFFSDVAAFLGADNDVIMICTLILSSSQVLTWMPFHSLKQPALFVDVLSVKEHARDSLTSIRATLHIGHAYSYMKWEEAVGYLSKLCTLVVGCVMLCHPSLEHQLLCLEMEKNEELYRKKWN